MPPSIRPLLFSIIVYKYWIWVFIIATGASDIDLTFWRFLN